MPSARLKAVGGTLDLENQRPLYQVLALDAAPRKAPPSASTDAVDDEPVDMKAVFARLWEVLG